MDHGRPDGAAGSLDEVRCQLHGIRPEDAYLPFERFIAGLTAVMLLLDDYRAYSGGGAHAIDWERVLKFGEKLNEAFAPIGA